MPVVIPPELAKTLLPRRPEDAKKPKRATPKTAWAHVRADVARLARLGKSGVEVAFVLGAPEAPEELRTRMQACAGLLELEAPPETLSIEAASALLACVNVSAMLDVLEGVAGLAFTLEAMVDSLRYEKAWLKGSPPSYVMKYSENEVRSETALRPRVLHAAPDVRAACRTAAERMWPSATIGQKLTLAYTFFEEDAWAHEVARAFVQSEPPMRLLAAESLYPIVRDPALMRAVIGRRSTSRSYLEVVASVGEPSLELIAEVFAAPRDEHEHRHAAVALSVFDDPRAATLLASGIASVKVRPALADYCARFPDTARAALEPIAQGKGRSAKLATELLGTIARTETSMQVDANRSDDVSSVERAGNTDNDSAESKEAARQALSNEADASELPWVLVRPPWLHRKKLPKRAWPKLTVDMLPREETVSLSEELEQLAREAFDPSAPTFKPNEELTDGAGLLRADARLDDGALFAHWNAGLSFATHHADRLIDVAAYVLRRFGTEAIPGLVHLLTRHHLRHKTTKSVLLAVDSPKLALAVAKLLGADRAHGDDAWGPYARRWMATRPATAVIGLVPSALAGSAEAERALRWLVARGEDVLAHARPYGDEAHEALTTLLGWDPRFDLPRVGKLPTFFRPETLTRPLLRNGKRLPLTAVAHLGTMLSFSETRFPYAGIADVKEVCDPRSLAEFAWDVARAWEIAGGKDSSFWMVRSLVHFADDEVVRRTTPAMRSAAIAEVLEMIGTEAAMMELVTIGARAASGNNRYSWAAGEIDRRIARIAIELRGVSGEELEDAVLPVRDVDYNGLRLDYGTRSFDVRFDERLEVFVMGEDGAKIRALPPARKTDDKAKVEAARRIWQDLREEVSAVVARRLARLERAMIGGKTWTASEFHRRYVDHPLLGHIGRSLVWVHDEARAFRVTEDGSLADAADQIVTLAPDARVRIAHPARMRPEDVNTWRQLFFDYKIVQPFAQIGRPIRPLSDAESAARRFERTPSRMPRAEIPQHLYERGFHKSQKRLSRGEATVNLGHGSSATITLTLSPTFLDFDPVEVAELLADIDV